MYIYIYIYYVITYYIYLRRGAVNRSVCFKREIMK